MQKTDTGVDFRTFFETAPGLLCVVGWDGYLLTTNLIWQDKLGLTAEELRAKPLVELTHPSDREVVLSALRRARAGEATTFEHRFECRDGNYQRLSWTVTPRPEEELIFAVVHDVTALDREMRRFKTLMEATPDFVAITDLMGKIIYTNPASMVMAGKSEEDYRELGMAALHPPALMPWYREEVIPAAMRDGVWSGETQFLDASGRAIPMSQVIVVIRDATGQPESLVTMARDLTPQKRMEQALKASLHELSAPIIQVWDGILALPLIGLVDSRRAAQMTEALLDSIVNQGCRVAILDLTGVRTIDTSTIEHLFKMIRAVSLLGSRCVVSGISPEVAQTVTLLNLDLSALRVFRSLQEALRFAMHEVEPRDGRTQGLAANQGQRRLG